nr:MAG TPA: hypothetical protein [Caudoviricetes sp.]
MIHTGGKGWSIVVRFHVRHKLKVNSSLTCWIK